MPRALQTWPEGGCTMATMSLLATGNPVAGGAIVMFDLIATAPPWSSDE